MAMIDHTRARPRQFKLNDHQWRRRLEDDAHRLYATYGAAVVSGMGFSALCDEQEARAVLEYVYGGPLPPGATVRTCPMGRQAFGRVYADMRSVGAAVALTRNLERAPEWAKGSNWHPGTWDLRIGTEAQHAHFLKREHERAYAQRRDARLAQWPASAEDVAPPEGGDATNRFPFPTDDVLVPGAAVPGHGHETCASGPPPPPYH
jgi:hypothetical protein